MLVKAGELLNGPKHHRLGQLLPARNLSEVRENLQV